jgi:hypothetical protein
MAEPEVREEDEWLYGESEDSKTVAEPQQKRARLEETDGVGSTSRLSKVGDAEGGGGVVEDNIVGKTVGVKDEGDDDTRSNATANTVSTGVAEGDGTSATTAGEGANNTNTETRVSYLT